MSKPEPILFLSDARGVNIPKDFANAFEDRKASVSGVDESTWMILEAGPEDEGYWDAWDEVERDAIVTDLGGTQYRIHMDGDCWLIPMGMGWDEKTDWWVWLEEKENVKS